MLPEERNRRIRASERVLDLIDSRRELATRPPRTESTARMPPFPLSPPGSPPGSQPRSQSRSEHFQTRDGIRLHTLVWRSQAARPDRGDSPVVLLHGGGANAHWWDHLAHALTAQNPVYALDFRGHGDSEYPESRRVGAFNGDLEELLAWLAREDVILIGHSLGATVALDHASRFPATRALVLVDLARGGNPATGRRARLALSLRRTYRTRADAVERFRFLPESSHASEALRAAIGSHSVREEPDGRFGYKFDPAWFALPSRPRPDLHELRCPTLLVRGSESTLLTTEAALAFTGEVATARLVEIADAGHHVLVDQPERLLVAVESFLAGLREPRPSSARATSPPSSSA